MYEMIYYMSDGYLFITTDGELVGLNDAGSRTWKDWTYFDPDEWTLLGLDVSSEELIEEGY